MTGAVDTNGRAIISIDVAAEESRPAIPTDAWIDTAFTGELVLPKAMVDELSLGVAASVDTILADGHQALAPTYRCWIDWFGDRREIEVIATDVAIPLLGVGLLLGHEVRISYSAMTVVVE